MKPEEKEAVQNRVVLLTQAPDRDVTFIQQLIDDAEAYALAETGRSELPAALLTAVGDLAIVAYNRAGTEGEGSRSEGGESYTFVEIPARIERSLKKYRLARVAGHAYEALT